MIVYKETPISELPEKDGYYFGSTNAGDQDKYFYSSNGLWYYWETDFEEWQLFGSENYITSWLKPIELSSIIEEQVKEHKFTLEDMRRAWYCFPHTNGAFPDTAFDNWIKTLTQST